MTPPNAAKGRALLADWEADRIAFLTARDGEPAAKAWALDTLRSYRKVVVQRKTHTMYRRGLIQSYLAFKRFALAKVEAPEPSAEAK